MGTHLVDVGLIQSFGVFLYRLSLTGTKKWRQTFKALTIMEYLLTHGPEQFIVEFREDKKRIEELTRFVFVDENLYVSDSPDSLIMRYSHFFAN